MQCMHSMAWLSGTAQTRVSGPAQHCSGPCGTIGQPSAPARRAALRCAALLLGTAGLQEVSLERRAALRCRTEGIDSLPPSEYSSIPRLRLHQRCTPHAVGMFASYSRVCRYVAAPVASLPVITWQPSHGRRQPCDRWLSNEPCALSPLVSLWVTHRSSPTVAQ